MAKEQALNDFDYIASFSNAPLTHFNLDWWGLIKNRSHTHMAYNIIYIIYIYTVYIERYGDIAHTRWTK